MKTCLNQAGLLIHHLALKDPTPEYASKWGLELLPQVKRCELVFQKPTNKPA